MSYPSKIESLVDVTSGQTLAAGGHAARHNDVNAALVELADVLTVPAVDTLAFVPNGVTERMRIDNAGLITGTGTSLGAWTAYTPTLGGAGWALGNGTVSGFYSQIGKVVHYVIYLTFGSTSTFGGSVLTLTAPSNRIAGRFYYGTGQSIDASLGVQVPLVVSNNSAGVFSLFSTTTGVGLSTTTPFTWANTDRITLSGTYEAA
jgi:hypothetical protein